MKDLRYLLDDEDVKFDKFASSFEVTNPATNEVVAYVKSTSTDELQLALEKASLAQKSWAKLTALQRSDILLKWYELVIKHQQDLAKIMTIEQGKSLNESLGEIQYSASFIRWFSEEARRIDGDILTSVKSSQKLLVIKEPLGVCVAITPWNFPAAMITRKAAPALASGCAMLVKPARQTPLSAYAQANLAYQAGVPKDLFKVICGDSKDIANFVTDSKIVKKISFTGSTSVGKEIYALSAKNIKKISLELGGNAPFIVFDDADLDQAVAGVMASKFRNSGQTCVCANRIYAQSGIYDEFCQKLSLAVGDLKLGNGLEKGVNQGPLIDQNALKKVKEHIQDALNKGAKCLNGGKESQLGGTFFEPTLLRDVSQNALVARDETFGPLCPVFEFATTQEVIELANDTDYGLASYIFTTDFKKQWLVSQALEYGMIGVNTGLISNEVAPFGGIKMSGIGKEGSKYGINEYLQMKYICLDLS